MPASRPEHNWSAPQAVLGSPRVSPIIVLENNLVKVSPIPTGYTPGFVSSAHSQPPRRARYTAHGGKEFASHSMINPRLALPNPSS
jgi:hypothetical protein